MNHQTPKIRHLNELRLAGLRKNMTLQESPAPLWKAFMPTLKDTDWDQDAGLFSVQIYPEGFSAGKTHMSIEKWACAVVNENEIPSGMEELIIPEGEYAVFIHHGPARAFPRTAQYIFQEWFPQSGYRMAARPQFEVMPRGYKGPEHPDAEEEVWIPIEKIN